MKSRDLGRAMRKIGRRMPKHMHGHAAILVEAEQFAGHPKLRMAVDPAKVDKAYAALHAHFETVDVWDRRKGTILSVLGSISLGLLTLAAAIVIVLRWRGFI
ncbi:hypothetical protein [Shimia sp. SDUM112013]|uniref:hypothetical protein n=1 Tax=Shimia sp. SDUM112013 TaxID=3136160 RepID=UPI0032EF4072